MIISYILAADWRMAADKRTERTEEYNDARFYYQS